ncbi:sulfotransferase domain-containing protein [Planctomycetaceae bacterium AH-315-I19]|nr:sulfotransferase domain-containing protein [Planctomycetaceae bacterium AH-315-I19]
MPSYPPKSRPRVLLERISNRLTRRVAVRYGPAFPQYYVCEYPRSGGTWLARMLADYFGIARPGPSVFPIGCRAVIHTHWKFHPRLRNVFVLTRDGRDVMTSYWFYYVRGIENKITYNHAALAQQFRQRYGEEFDTQNTSKHLATFIRNEFANPRGARQNWADYNRVWYDPARFSWIGYLTYEQLLSDPVGAMSKAISHVTDKPADEARIRRTVDHFSMSSDTGRKQGEEDRSSFIRKGIAGDWKNHFTPETARVFNELAGDMLIKLGYEQDDSWVERFTQEYEQHTRTAETSTA